MSLFSIWLCFVGGYILAHLAQMHRHNTNFHLLVGRGAEEYARSSMRIYYGLPWLVFASAAGEYLLFVEDFPLLSQRLAGVSLIVAGFALRFWVINSLGWLWTMACLHRQGFPQIEKGPYRWISHPEYVGRFIELSGFCLFLNSHFTLVAYGITGLAMTFHIIRLEHQQRAHYLAGPECPPG